MDDDDDTDELLEREPSELFLKIYLQRLHSIKVYMMFTKLKSQVLFLVVYDNLKSLNYCKLFCLDFIFFSFKLYRTMMKIFLQSTCPLLAFQDKPNQHKIIGY